jgi:long-subunit fatty acid transport protein
MKKFSLISITLLLISSIGFSQTEMAEMKAGAKAGGMGNASVTFQDVWSIFNNPAGIAELETMNVGIFFENRFAQKELGYGNIVYNYPLGEGNLGLGVSHFGHSDFSSYIIGITYAQKLHEYISMGVKVDYIGVNQLAEYGNFQGVSFDIGLLSQPIENLTVGFHAFNPANLSYFTEDKLKIPMAFKLGASYFITDDLMAAVESGLAFNADIPLIRAGLQYQAYDNFFLRTGFSGREIEYNFGIGYVYDNMIFDLAFAYHQFLGSSPKISFMYEF